MFKVFGSETLLSEDMNAIMRQTIIRVANAAELDTIAPALAGMMAYREDTGGTYRYDGSTWREVIAANVDTEIPETFFTPGAGVTITNGAAARAGGLVSIRLTVSGVGITSGAQLSNIGTFAPAWRPSNFTHWAGWNAQAPLITGLIGSDGNISVRYSTSASTSGGIYIAATFPSLII